MLPVYCNESVSPFSAQTLRTAVCTVAWRFASCTTPHCSQRAPSWAEIDCVPICICAAFVRAPESSSFVLTTPFWILDGAAPPCMRLKKPNMEGHASGAIVDMPSSCSTRALRPSARVGLLAALRSKAK